MKTRVLIATGSLAVAIAMSLGSSAEAHHTCVSLGANVACVDAYHNQIDACDRESNGRRVRAHYYIILNPNYYIGSWDPNGAASGCAHDRPGVEITYYRVCEEITGCSGWIKT